MTPPPPRGVGTFLNFGLFWNGLTPPPKINLGLGTFLKRNDPLKIFRNKLNMKNIGTKSVNMSDIMVYLAMFSTTIDNILWFWVLIIWKWAIILLVFGTLWNLGLFWRLFRLESFPKMEEKKKEKKEEIKTSVTSFLWPSAQKEYHVLQSRI